MAAATPVGGGGEVAVLAVPSVCEAASSGAAANQLVLFFLEPCNADTEVPYSNGTGNADGG